MTTADSPTHEPLAPITVRSVFALALPVTLAYLTTPLLGLVDTAVVGRLGDAALIGGLAVGAVIIDVVFATFNFQRSSTTGLIAQALGAGDRVEIRAVLLRALLVALVAGLGLAVLGWPILQLALWAMAPGDAVAAAASSYFLIRMFAAPFTLASYAILGWAIGLGRSGLALGLQIWLNGVNIVLSVILGLWLGYGLAGVAAATVIAEIAAVIVGIIVYRRSYRGEPTVPRQRILQRAAFARLVSLNGDIMLRSFLLLAAFAMFTAKGAQLGAVTLAANAILMHLFMIAGYFLDGMATAAEQLVGTAIGARSRQRFVRGIGVSLGVNVILALALCVLFLAAGGGLVALLTTLAEVRETANHYLVWAALTPLAGVVAFHMDGVYIGATWGRAMSVMMVTSFVLYVIALYGLQHLGNHGLWAALIVFLLARGVTLGGLLPFKTRQAFAA